MRGLISLVALVGCTGGPVASLSEAFEHAGFTVQAGEVSSFLLDDCEALSRCFGNNANTPYLLFNVPGYPDREDTIPPSTVGDVPKVPDGMSASYRLQPNEALVVYGRTPPTATYFGFTPYVYTRVDADGETVPVFASVTDTVNHLTIQTDSQTAFDAETAVIMTSDAQTMASARAALEEQGIPAAAINELGVPGDRIHFGLGDQSDTTLLLGRIAMIDDSNEARDYLADVPLEVYRLTTDQSGEPVTVPARKERGNGLTEDALLDALAALDEAITMEADVQFEAVDVSSASFIETIINPSTCLNYTTECLADNSDTVYAAGPLSVIQGDDSLTLTDEDHFVVFGVNHVAAGKALYSNAVVYTDEKRIGVASITDTDMLGSAASYLPNHPDAEKLFAYTIRRDCGERPYCLTLPTTFPGVPLSESLFFIFRAYINPGMTVSPAPTELLTERVYRVRPRD